MRQDIEEEEKVNGFHIFGMVLPSLPSLMFRLGGVFLRFKIEAKKGGHIFKKELINQGLDEATAAKLTQTYLESSNIINFVHLLR